MKCALCGYEFDPQETDCHSGCPLNDRCSLICCPNCGYQTVDRSKSKTVGLISRLLGPKNPSEKRS